MKRFALVLLILLALMVGGGAVAQAAANTNQGQPNQSCEEQPSSPGNASTAPGSAFNPDGHSGTVYAGEQPQNSNNPNSVSQYDVACYQVSQH